MASKGGKPIQLTFGGGEQPLESADDTVVYYVKQLGETKNEVWKVPVSGGDEERVLGPVNAFHYSISGYHRESTSLSLAQSYMLVPVETRSSSTASQVVPRKQSRTSGLTQTAASAFHPMVDTL